MTHNDEVERSTRQDHIPDYLKEWRGLSMRVGASLVEALPEDVEVAKSYLFWEGKGAIVDGKRLSIQARKGIFKVNEEIRVIHVVEVPEPGHVVYIMGPKRVYGEFVDGRIATDMPPEWEGDPLAPADYDGVTLESPAVDYNYDITTYTFERPGVHEIYWEINKRRSNTLKISVVE